MPVAASFCADFLKADMQHVYRQVAGLREFGSVVLTRRRENAGAFPFPEDRIAVIPKPAFRFAVRIWQRSIKGGPLQLTAREVRDCLAALERFKADVLHVYFGHIGIFALPLLRAWRGARIVSFHGADAGVDAGSAAHRRALAEVFALSDLIQGRSEALLADLAALGCPQEKLRLQRTALPLDELPFSERPVPPVGGAWHFTQACRLIEKKGLLTTLRAFAAIAKALPNARLTIAGDGPMLADLRAFADELGVGARVAFPGFLGQAALRSLFAESHAFFHPSQTGADGNREGVPNAMLEAMAMGLPALATRHGGIPEAVEDGEGGLLVTERDHQALAAAALRLAGDPALYRQLAAGGRRAAEEKFGGEAQIKVLESCYRMAILKATQRNATA